MTCCIYIHNGCTPKWLIFLQYQIDFMACMQWPMSPNRSNLCLHYTVRLSKGFYLLPAVSSPEYWKNIADIAPFAESHRTRTHTHNTPIPPNLHFSHLLAQNNTTKDTLNTDRNAKGNRFVGCIIHRIKCDEKSESQKYNVFRCSDMSP